LNWSGLFCRSALKPISGISAYRSAPAPRPPAPCSVLRSARFFDSRSPLRSAHVTFRPVPPRLRSAHTNSLTQRRSGAAKRPWLNGRSSLLLGMSEGFSYPTAEGGSRQSYSENNRVTSFFLRHSVDYRLSPAVFDMGPTVYTVFTHITQ